MGPKSEELKQKAFHEFKEFLVIALYLWTIFSLFLLYKAVILNESISSVSHGTALINALVLGKFVLIAHDLPRFSHPCRTEDLNVSANSLGVR